MTVNYIFSFSFSFPSIYFLCCAFSPVNGCVSSTKQIFFTNIHKQYCTHRHHPQTISNNQYQSIKQCAKFYYQLNSDQINYIQNISQSKMLCLRACELISDQKYSNSSAIADAPKKSAAAAAASKHIHIHSNTSGPHQICNQNYKKPHQ